MKIVDQKREHIYNFDNCFEISVDGKGICLRATYDSRYKIIGIYDEDRAREVFDEILREAYPELMTGKGQVIMERPTYYMPEE